MLIKEGEKSPLSATRSLARKSTPLYLELNLSGMCSGPGIGLTCIRYVLLRMSHAALHMGW